MSEKVEDHKKNEINYIGTVFSYIIQEGNYNVDIKTLVLEDPDDITDEGRIDYLLSTAKILFFNIYYCTYYIFNFKDVHFSSINWNGKIKDIRKNDLIDTYLESNKT